MAEDDLIRRLRSGDAAASVALFELCQGRIRDFLATRLPDSSEVDDSVSEVVTRALEGIRRGQEPESLQAWLLGIARNLLKARYREENRRSEADVVGDIPYPPMEPYLELEHSKIDIEDLLTVPSDVETLMNKRDLWALLQLAIGGIPTPLQLVMREHIRLSVQRDRLTYGAELAAVLGLPVDVVNRQLQRARLATWRAIVALVLARTGRTDCSALASLLDDVLSPQQQEAGSSLVLTAEQCKVILNHADACQICDRRRAEGADYQGFAVPSATNSRVSHPASSSLELPISLFLSDETAHEDVQRAVEDLVSVAGGWIEDADDPIIGSWFRRMRARVRAAARTSMGRELAYVAAHATEARLVLSQDATVTATMLQNLGPVLTALQPTKDAVIRVGALLIVKVDGVVGVHQLTSAQQLQLDHQPRLAMAPHEILAVLQLDSSDTAADDQGPIDSAPC